MRRSFSTMLLNDILNTVQTVADSSSVIDISALAEQVRQRNARENVALEDIIEALMQQAQWLNLSIEFSGKHGRAARDVVERAG